jgi:glycosyltransferase involved in cell wall biosynthesis
MSRPRPLALTTRPDGASGLLESGTALASEQKAQHLKTLIIAGWGKLPESEIREQIARDQMPDVISAEAAIGGFYVDNRLFATLPGLRGRVMRRLPFRIAQLAEAFLRRRDYDAVLTWGDISTVLFAAAMRLWPNRPALVAIPIWPSKPKKAIPLRLVRGSIDRVVMWPPLQRRFLEDRLGIPADRFIDVHQLVDTRFWRPMERQQNLICAVGQEMRDYKTLITALRPLPIPCHIAVGTHMFATTSESWWKDSLESDLLPPTLTVGPKAFPELRELYARARFVVVPLIPSDMDNGITTIQEAFAMGRAVIATRTPGQAGVLEDGVNSVIVPPHDPIALRHAIADLWEDSDRCARLGAAGRALVEQENGIERWTASLEQAVAEAVASRRGAVRGRA